MLNNPFVNTIILGTIAYVAIIFMLRISGNLSNSSASALKDVKECHRLDRVNSY